MVLCALFIGCAVFTAACAIVDQYAPRSIDYNLEAERVQQQALSLDVVRANRRRPMQFTAIASISGPKNGATTSELDPFVDQTPKGGRRRGTAGLKVEEMQMN